MKIRIVNLLDKILEKFNLERKNKTSKGKVIKFESDLEVEQEIQRKGALSENEQIDTKRLSRQGIKILTSMILLLLLTISIGVNSKLPQTNITLEEKEVSSVATSSSIDNNSNENIVLASKAKPVEQKLVFSKPLDGKIQKMYSTDKVIYSKTLSQWKTHDGLDIEAVNSSEVKAIERGVVEEIYNDSFYGKTIVIEHISGYRSQYSNLEEDVYVNIGESVIKGQKIGKVGNTAVGEYLDEPHLHFMVFLNDKSIDPTYIYN